MFTTGTQTKSKSCFIQNYTGNHQNQNSQISSNIGILEKHSSYHRNISQNRYFFNSELILKRNLLHIADYSGNKNSKCRSEHIDCCTADTLICLHIYRGICMNQRYHHSGHHRNQQCNQQNRLSGKYTLKQIDKQNPGKSAQHHDALQSNVDNTASLTEHSSQCNDQQRDGKKHHLLNQKI